MIESYGFMGRHLSRAMVGREQHMCPSPRLTATDVHLWRIHLLAPENAIQHYHQLLSDDEINRADRFHFERDRSRFVIARAAMRTILSDYLHVLPSKLLFSYAAKGKPELPSGLRVTDINFNLARSLDFGLLAVTSGLSVGVDIEFVDREFAAAEIATRFFSPREVTTLLTLPCAERAAAFFDCWTRKEAYIKALGEGLSIPLRNFDVAFGPGVPAALLQVDGSSNELSRWRMYDIPAPQGYAAAVVVEGKRHNLCQLQFEPPV